MKRGCSKIVVLILGIRMVCVFFRGQFRFPMKSHGAWGKSIKQHYVLWQTEKWGRLFEEKEESYFRKERNIFRSHFEQIASPRPQGEHTELAVAVARDLSLPEAEAPEAILEPLPATTVDFECAWAPLPHFGAPTLWICNLCHTMIRRGRLSVFHLQTPPTQTSETPTLTLLHPHPCLSGLCSAPLETFSVEKVRRHQH